MKTKVLGLLAMFMFAVITVFAADKTEKIQVKASDTCKDKIEQAAKTVDGVSQAEWDNDNQQLVVVFDDASADLDAIELAVADAGFDTPNHMATDEAYDMLPDDCKTRESVQPKDTISADTLSKKW